MAVNAWIGSVDISRGQYTARAVTRQARFRSEEAHCKLNECVKRLVSHTYILAVSALSVKISIKMAFRPAASSVERDGKLDSRHQKIARPVELGSEIRARGSESPRRVL